MLRVRLISLGLIIFFKQLFEIFNDLNVDIVNNSYGFSGNIIDYTESQVRFAFPKTIEEMAQVGVPDSEKTIYVWAAGNAGGYADQGCRLFQSRTFSRNGLHDP